MAIHFMSMSMYNHSLASVLKHNIKKTSSLRINEWVPMRRQTQQKPLLLTRIIFRPRMDEESRTHYNGCNYLSMLEFKLIHDSNRDPRDIIKPVYICDGHEHEFVIPSESLPYYRESFSNHTRHLCNMISSKPEVPRFVHRCVRRSDIWQGSR